MEFEAVSVSNFTVCTVIQKLVICELVWSYRCYWFALQARDVDCKQQHHMIKEQKGNGMVPQRSKFPF